MSKSLLELFDDLTSHLNAEDNELAKVFKAKLAIHLCNVRSLEEDSEFLAKLRAYGVDNWDGYGMWLDDEEDEEDE